MNLLNLKYFSSSPKINGNNDMFRNKINEKNWQYFINLLDLHIDNHNNDDAFNLSLNIK